ncbi:MAG: hypothetical protein ACOY3L_14335 [Pseudomonadota bacterium]
MSATELDDALLQKAAALPEKAKAAYREYLSASDMLSAAKEVQQRCNKAWQHVTEVLDRRTKAIAALSEATKALGSLEAIDVDLVAAFHDLGRRFDTGFVLKITDVTDAVVSAYRGDQPGCVTRHQALVDELAAQRAKEEREAKDRVKWAEGQLQQAKLELATLKKNDA